MPLRILLLLFWHGAYRNMRNLQEERLSRMQVDCLLDVSTCRRVIRQAGLADYSALLC
jgi:hypothetical protein